LLTDQAIIAYWVLIDEVHEDHKGRNHEEREEREDEAIDIWL